MRGFWKLTADGLRVSMMLAVVVAGMNFVDAARAQTSPGECLTAEELSLAEDLNA
jgi:hypothetical protein